MDNIIAENLLLVCSICLQSISDNEERSMAKLKCGHRFHLDCIGSAFNMNGAMMCPNCGNVEDGNWLYASASTSSSSDFNFDYYNLDDWDDLYDFLFNDDESTFSGMTGDSSFEQVESSPTPTLDRELPRNHAVFGERMAASPLAHSHVYVPPIYSAISHASDNVDPIFNRHINGQSGQDELYNLNPFLAANVQYQSGGRHLPPLSANRTLLNSVDQVLDPSTLRSTRVDSDAMSRSGPSALPIHYRDTFPGVRTSFVSSLNHPGSVTHSHIQVSDVGHPPQGNPTSVILPITPGARRFSGPTGVPVYSPAPPASLISPIMPGARRFSDLVPVSTPAPPQASFSFFSHPSSLNLYLENRNRFSRFPFMSFDMELGWESQQQTFGGSNPSHSSGNSWPQGP